ncbi:MAG: hypothetical protein LBI47_03380 [Puniceicoccales bacterium]|jgi:hypothetical protein|nr:hypothetical protein [Puniceicoccales bacterium]
MNRFDTDINELDKAGSTGKVQEFKETPIIVYEPSISTVASILGENKTPPPSIESRGGDMATVVTQVAPPPAQSNDLQNVQERLDQIRQFPADRVMEVGREEIQAIFPIISDIDGDGIPDDLDKNPGETIANVAARINKIGKYAVTDDNKAKIFSALKGITKSLDSLLNKISAMSAAASSSFKPTTGASALDGLDGEENPFSSKKVDKDFR